MTENLLLAPRLLPEQKTAAPEERVQPKMLPFNESFPPPAHTEMAENRKNTEQKVNVTKETHATFTSLKN